jgi:exodeoxyribonuclease VII large subunit
MLNFNVITVSQLNTYLKSILDGDKILRDCLVKGEISNFKKHFPSGHLYFTIKDKNSAIKAVMFKANVQRLKFVPSDGLEVILRGNISLYEQGGTIQFYTVDMLPEGLGALNLAFEQLKEKLSKEGLFDQEHKKAVPKFPGTIGVVSAKTGAALREIFNVLSRRYSAVRLLLAPATVQGDSAGGEISRGIKALNRVGCDVIILARGGGSLEELWAFNTETVARAIYASRIPVISAVGHETDFTIADFTADLRAPTPSAAAELASPDARAVLQRLDGLVEDIRSSTARKAGNIRSRLEFLDDRADPGKYIKEKRVRLDNIVQACQNNIMAFLKNCRANAVALAGMISAMNPLEVLNRGYLLASKSGTPVKSVSGIEPGDVLDLRFVDGKISAEVLQEVPKGEIRK